MVAGVVTTKSPASICNPGTLLSISTNTFFGYMYRTDVVDKPIESTVVRMNCNKLLVAAIKSSGSGAGENVKLFPDCNCING